MSQINPTSLDPLAALYGPDACKDLVQSGLSTMKIAVPGTRRQIAEEANAPIHTLAVEAGGLMYRVAAIQKAQKEIEIARDEFMSLTRESAPWGQVTTATKRFEEVCRQACDMVFDSEPSITYPMEREFKSQYAAGVQ